MFLLYKKMIFIIFEPDISGESAKMRNAPSKLKHSHCTTAGGECQYIVCEKIIKYYILYFNLFHPAQGRLAHKGLNDG